MRFGKEAEARLRDLLSHDGDESPGEKQGFPFPVTFKHSSLYRSKSEF